MKRRGQDLGPARAQYVDADGHTHETEWPVRERYPLSSAEETAIADCLYEGLPDLDSYNRPKGEE